MKGYLSRTIWIVVVLVNVVLLKDSFVLFLDHVDNDDDDGHYVHGDDGNGNVMNLPVVDHDGGDDDDDEKTRRRKNVYFDDDDDVYWNYFLLVSFSLLLL